MAIDHLVSTTASRFKDEPSAVSPQPYSAVARVHSPPATPHSDQPECEFKALSSEQNEASTSEIVSLAKLSLPIVETFVLELLPGVVSVALVGRMDSPLTKEYVDGAALSNMFTNLSGVAIVLATAMDTLCSQAYGAGRAKNMGIYFQSGLAVTAVALVPVVIVNWFTEAFLLLMGQHPHITTLAGRFSRLSIPGLPFLFVYELLKKVFQAQNVVEPMVFIAIWSNVVNLALGAYLTRYTPLGFDGAAIARSVACAALLIGVVPYFIWRPRMLSEWWSGWSRDAIRHTKTFLRLGVPGMVMIMLEWWSYEAIAVIIGLLPNSVVALSVHSVLVNVSNISFNFFMGIAVATSIKAGNYVGSGQPMRARLVSRLGLLLSVLVAIILGVVIAMSRRVLPQLFIDDSTSVMLASGALLFLLPFQLVDACNCVMQGIFRGTGRQTFAAAINFFAYYVVGLPLGVLLAFQFGLGVEGCWIGLTGGIACALVASLVRMRHTDWHELAHAAQERTTLETDVPSVV